MPKEIWKTVIRSERNMREAMNSLMDDYEELLDFYNTYSEENVDDSTWVHVDCVREERELLEEEIEKLKKENQRLREELEEVKSKGSSKKTRLRKRLVPKEVEDDDFLPF